MGDLLIRKGAIATSQGRRIYRAGKGKGKGTNRAGEGFLRAGYGIVIVKWIFNTASSFN